MGAGNSTAASCSSLDLANGQTANKYRHYQRQQTRQQQYLHEHKLQRYSRKQSGAGQPTANGGYLRQASSHFDLTSSHLVRDDEEEANNLRGPSQNNTELHYGFSRPGEAYNLTNADVSCPVMVLPAEGVRHKSPAAHVLSPASPVIHLAGGGAKKSNAGVASRILQHRQQQQQQRSSELKKFSDSLPSLNNISCQQQSRGAEMRPIGCNGNGNENVPPLHHQQHKQHRQMKPTFQHINHHHHQLHPPPPQALHQQHRQHHRSNMQDYQHEQCPSPILSNQQQKLRSKDRTSAIQLQQQQQSQVRQQLTTSKQKVSNAILVSPATSKLNNSCYNLHAQAQPFIIDDDQLAMAGQHQMFDRPNKKHNHHHHHHHLHQQQHQMKRATSLSSLHNINQSNQQQHNHHHQGRHPSAYANQNQNQKQHRQQLDMIIPTPFAQSIQLGGQASNVTNFQRCHDVRGSPRPPSLGLRKSGEPIISGPTSNYLGQSPMQQLVSDELRGAPYKLPPQAPPPQLHNHQSHLQQQQQQAMMLKRNNKYKQSANIASQPAKSNRYKSKLQQQQQQQQVQGCPVLPQLPRSQSLHELIQLRATENGQRMRTTGTLRGPLNNPEQVGRVNLVAELLENRRRQQRQTLDEDDKTTPPNKSSETLLSQSSSTDDGIHDVSIHGDGGQSSTNDSRSKHASSSSSSANTNTNRWSMSSHDGDDTNRTRAPARQRIFKKQPVASSQADRFVRKSSLEQRQAKQDGSRQLEVEGRTSKDHQQQHSHKSTLKRSTSYSALQTSHRLPGGKHAACDSYDERDGDESDDLNELARFLYQFKQRQTKTTAGGDGKLQPVASPDDDEGHSRARHQDHVAVLDQRKLSSPAAKTQIQDNLHQSPNSTTSSSGFASSTCTSHSASFASGGSGSSSSSGSNKKRLFESVSSASSHEIAGEHARARGELINPPKSVKYPAPPRPDQTQELRLAKSGGNSDGNNTNAKSCLLSGKLKLSSSLLSIVDEYQSTLENNPNRLLSRNLHATSSSNLASSSHLYGDACSASQAKFNFSIAGELKHNSKTSASKKDQLADETRDQEQDRDQEQLQQQQQHEEHETELQREQFEQLRKYTKLRQMSQSELALNHLTSSTMLDIPNGKHRMLPKRANQGGKASQANSSSSNLAEGKSSSSSGGSSNNSNGRPYTNRLFNLIRRIGERSEVGGGSHRVGGRDGGGAANPIGESSSSQAYPVGKLAANHGSGHGGGSDGSGASSVGGQLVREAGLNAINQIGTRAEHRPAGTCDGVTANRAAVAGLDNESKAMSNSSSSYSKLSLVESNHHQAKGVDCGRKTGESLCDLNFDCDFELIKNCRSANELNEPATCRQGPNSGKTSCSRQDISKASAAVRKPGSLFTNASSSITGNNELGELHQACGGDGGGKKKSLAAIEKKRKQNEPQANHNKAIANPSRENNNNNNWRLAPASSLLGLTNSCSSIGDTRAGRDLPRLGHGFSNHRHHHHHDANNYNANSQQGKANGQPAEQTSEGLAAAAGGCCGVGVKDELSQACKQQQQPPSKSKWSASSWLLGVGSGEKKKGSPSGKKPTTTTTTKSPAGGEPKASSAGKSYLARLIPTSGTPPTSASGAKSKQRQGDIAGNKRPPCDMISEADKLLVELDQSLDLVSGRSSEQGGWWQGDSNEMNDHEERQASAEQNEGVCMNRGDHHNRAPAAAGSDDEDDNDDADYASINRAMINETFDFDPEQMDLANGLTIQPGSPSDSFTFSAPSSPTLNELKVKAQGCSLPDDHQKGPSKQLNDETSRECNDGKQSRRNGSDHSDYSHEQQQQQQRASQAAITTTFTKGAVLSQPADVAARKGDNAVRAMDNHIRQHNSRSEHTTDELQLPSQGKLGSDCGDVRSANKLLTSANGCRLQLDDNKMGAAVPPANLASTYKKIPSQPNCQVEAPSGHIRGCRNGSHDHELNPDACATFNACNHRQPADRADSCNGAGGQTVANDCVTPDSCHRRHRDAPLSRLLLPAAKQQVSATSTTTPIAANPSVLRQAGALTNGSTRYDWDHNARLNLRLAAGESEQAGCIDAGERSSDECSLEWPDTGVKCHGKRDSNALGEIKADLAGQQQQQQSRRATENSVCPIHGRQPLCCRGTCCAPPTADSGNNGGRLCCNTTTNCNLKQQARQLDRHHHHSDSGSAKGVCNGSTQNSNKIELNQASGELAGAEKEEAGASQACNCKLAATRANVNMASRQNFPNGGVHQLAKESHVSGGDCSGELSQSRMELRTKNCNGGCAAAHSLKGCVPCSRRGESHSKEDDKLIIQKDFCHCCSSCAPGEHGQVLGSDGAETKMASAKSPNAPGLQTPLLACTAGANTCSNKCCRPLVSAGPLAAKKEPLEAERNPAAGGACSKESPKVTYYHYSHKMGNFTPTTTNGYHNHHHNNSRPPDAPGKCENQPAGAAFGLRHCISNSSKDAVCPPPNRAHQLGCACEKLADENDDTPEPNSSQCSKSSPCNKMAAITSLGQSPSDSRLRLNEDVSKLRCSHKGGIGGGCGCGTGMNYATPEEEPNGRNRKMEFPEQIQPNGAPVTNCCGSTGLKRASELNSPQATGGGGQVQTTPLECLDRLQARKCELVNNRSALGHGQMCQSNNERSSSSPSTNRNGQFGHQTGCEDHTKQRLNYPDNRQVGSGSVLFGKLRNSLLNQRAQQVSSSSSGKHLAASGQVSQENYYGGLGVQSAIQSILLPAGGDFAHHHTKSSHKLSASTNDFDENFILKRKTPNAGLKSRC